MFLLKKDYVQIPLIYLILGVLWIFFTDSIVHALVKDPELLRGFQMIKGWLFVILSACVILILVTIHNRRTAMERAKRELIFHKTVAGSCHIILNYLNQMKLLTIEAEKCADFDPGLLEEVEQIGARALRLLRELDALEIIESEEIEALIYGGLKGTDSDYGPI